MWLFGPSPASYFSPHLFILGLVLTGTSLEKTSSWGPFFFPPHFLSHAHLARVGSFKMFTETQGPLALAVLASKFAPAQFELYDAAPHLMNWNCHQRSGKLGGYLLLTVHFYFQQSDHCWLHSCTMSQFVTEHRVQSKEENRLYSLRVSCFVIFANKCDAASLSSFWLTSDVHPVKSLL